MLSIILLMFGLVPSGEISNPCRLPGWAINHKVAVACDMKEVEPKQGGNTAIRIIGKRSRVEFGIGMLNAPTAQRGQKVIVYTVKSQGNEAHDIARLVGPYGGVVNSKFGLAGVNGVWTVSVENMNISSLKKEGVVVRIVE